MLTKTSKNRQNIDQNVEKLSNLSKNRSKPLKYRKPGKNSKNVQKLAKYVQKGRGTETIPTKMSEKRENTNKKVEKPLKYQLKFRKTEKKFKKLAKM